MLLISDLHLTDKKIDKYRWDVFDFVLNYHKEHEDKNLVILGDLTDSKDHHSSLLANTIVSSMRMLVESGMEIFILKGNHDYIDPDLPFFQFLNEIQYVHFIKDPSLWLIQGEKCLFLPHTRNPIDEWETNKKVQKWRKKCDLVFIHQSVIGSVTSNGYEMDKGLSPKYFDKFRGYVFAGDIHVPQKIVERKQFHPHVEYVGSPYSIRFNDHFEGQAIALTNFPVSKSGISIPPSNLLKNEIPTKLQSRRTIEIHNLEDLEKADANPEDQVKVRVHTRHSVSLGENYKQQIKDRCEELGFELCELSLVKDRKFPIRGPGKYKHKGKEARPVEIVQSFSKKKGIDKNKRSIGLSLVED